MIVNYQQLLIGGMSMGAKTFSRRSSRVCVVISTLAAAIVSFSLSATGARAQANVNSPVGTNLDGVGYYTSEQPFLNIFKTAGGWSTLSSNGQDTNEEVSLYQNFLDSNGYPTTLTGGAVHSFTKVSALVFRNLNSVTNPNQFYPAGDYLFQFDGTGTFAFNFDVSSTCSTSPCVLHVPNPTSGGILITLNQTGSGSNYANNFRLFYCGTWSGSSCSNGYDKLLASGEIFNPSFITLMKPFKTLRLMNWMTAGNNFQKDWSDRPLPGWVFYDDSRTNATINGADPRNLNDGVPAEVMFALCNELNADCWFTMPPLATDDYVTQFATLALSQLKTNLKVYVEYANEVWNNVFGPASGSMTQSVWQQMEALGAATYPGLGNSWGAAFQYGILRAVQVGADWKTAWGPDAARVVRVAAGQDSYVGRNQWILTSFPNGSNTLGQPSQGGPTYWYGTTGGTVAQNVDVFATAPYFGYAVPDSFTLNQLFTELQSGGIAPGGYPGGMVKQALDNAAGDFSVARAAGLPLVAYEGGQSLVAIGDSTLVALYSAANVDPRMQAVYTTYLAGWKSLGGTLFNNFSDIGQNSQWGNWGALENVMQTSSPKYTALLNFISNNPCWWSGCSNSTSVAGWTDKLQSGTSGSVGATSSGTASSATSGTSSSGTSSSGTSGTVSSGSVSSGSVSSEHASSGTASSETASSETASSTLGAPSLASSQPAFGSVGAANQNAPTNLGGNEPKVYLQSPRNGSVVEGANIIEVESTANGSNGIASMTLMADGKTIGSCSNTTSCSTSLAGFRLTRGTHVISAAVVDKLGLKSSTSVVVLSLR